MMPENAETQSWVTKTVWQWIPGRRARNSKTPTTMVIYLFIMKIVHEVHSIGLNN